MNKLISILVAALKSSDKIVDLFKGLLWGKRVGMVLALLFVLGGGAWGQTTIVSDGLNSSSSVFSLSGGAYYAVSSASDRPASVPFYSEGTAARGVSNATATLTSGDINTSAYANITMTLDVAAFSIGVTNRGVNSNDNILVEVSPNGGTNYYPIVKLNGSNATNTYAYWSYTSGTGNASVTYSTTATPTAFTPAAGGARTTDGYSVITISQLPSSTNMRVRISMITGANSRRWVIDNFRLTGCPLPAQSSTITGTADPCIGSSQTYSVTNVSGVTYNWTFPTGWAQTAGGTTNSVTATVGATAGNITVTPSNACGSGTARTLAVGITPADAQTTAGTNTWVGHVYDGTNFDTYVGNYTEAETFDQNFGGSTNCFNVTANTTARSILTETFSAKYRMNSTKKGLYVADIASDDGARLTVDGTKVYETWADRAYTNNKGVLFNLNGSSNLLFEYFSNNGDNELSFQNLTQVLANTLTTNTTQSLCVGSAGTEISGDTYGTLPAGVSLSGTGYQWTYSTTAGGARTNIAGATGATFIPSATVAPFNTEGTYYVYRNAVLSSVNNISPNPYVASNESNAAIITVLAVPAAAGTITGLATVTQGQSTVAYTVPAITNATSYNWTYSGAGATINGAGNSVTIDFSATATSGNLNVQGVSACGNGTVSANFPITVSTTALAIVSPTSGLVTTEGGGTATFTVKLGAKPTTGNNVTITLTSSDPTEGTVSPVTLIFTPTNYSTPQTVTVTGVDDNYIDGSVAYSIIAKATSTDLKFNNIDVPDVSVTNIDNDAVATGSIEVDRKEPEGGYGATDLVQNVLVHGCLKASNVTFNSKSNTKDIQLGYFNKGTSDFPLSEGIIMSTGKVRDAEGPNDVTDKTTQVGSVGDNSINSITSKSSYDAAVLEFDFVPAGNKVQFNYIFASEEYAEYIGATYNDAFAFLISGPGITGTKNIALVPGTTSTAVSINNVHGPTYNRTNTTTTRVYSPLGAYTDLNGTYYNKISPVITSSITSNSAYFVDNEICGADTTKNGSGKIQTINTVVPGRSNQFDGRTTVLTATQDVTACETYHIKLVVADVGDSQYDSGVFLEAKSFTSNEVTVKNLLATATDDKESMYEGCDKSYMRFVRGAESNLAEELSIDVQISGTATNGVDYQYINSAGAVVDGGYGLGVFPSKITIPAGSQYADYYYKAVKDGVKEPNETIIFQVVSSCPCDPVVSYFTKTVNIIDAPEIEATASANVKCGASGTPVATITVALPDGMNTNDYLFSMDGGATQTSNQFVGTWAAGSIHTVTVGDKYSCQSTTSSTTIPAVSSILANAGADKEMCQLQSGVKLSGSGGIYYEWSCVPSTGVNYLSDKNVAQPTVLSTIPVGVYTFTLLVQDQSGSAPLCKGSDDMVLTVKATPVVTLTADQTEVCSGTLINLKTTVTNGVAPLIYSWNPSSELNDATIANPSFTPVVTSLSSRSFTVKVTSDNGCSSTGQVSNITINPSPVITLGTVTGATCSDKADGQATISASGGTPGTSPAYIYDWINSSNAKVGSAATIAGVIPGNYTITVYDSKNCSTSKAITIGTVELLSLAVSDATICNPATSDVPVTITSAQNGYTYELRTSSGASLTPAVTAVGTGADLNLKILKANAPLSTTAYNVYVSISGCTALALTDKPTVTVNAATVISGQSMAAQTACLDGTYSPISVTATGFGTLTYKWYNNVSANTTGGTEITDATSSNYTPSASSVGTLYYYCVVSGGCGASTSSVSGAFITNPLPSITLGSLTSVCKGASAFSLPYSALGQSPTTYSIVAGTPALSGFTSLANASISSSPLGISIPSSASAGTYQFIITVKNANGCVSTGTNFDLKINPLPVTGPAYRLPNN